MKRAKMGYQTLPLFIANKLIGEINEEFICISCCLVLLGVALPVFAEDVTVTTYYPSPRGVYEEIRTTGNTGVGTTAPPSARLHVVQPNAADSLRVDDQAGDASPFIIDRDGHVGLQTPTPTARLEVLYNGSPHNDSVVKITSDNTLPAFLQFLHDDAVDQDWRFYVDLDDRLTIQDATDSRDVMTFDGLGRVGINETNPQALLHVTDSVGALDLRLQSTPGAGSVMDLVAGNGITGINVDNAASSVDFDIGVNGTSRFHIEDNGNVGLSTMTPNARLSVGGNGLAGTAVHAEQGGVVGRGVAAIGPGSGVEARASLGAGSIAGISATTHDPATIPIGEVPNGAGVFAYGHAYGIRAVATDAGSIGVYGKAPGWAGDFIGNARVSDDLWVGDDIDVQGDISVSGAITGDVAEFMSCSACSPMDVVVIDPEINQQLTPSYRAYDPSVAGVVSVSPSLKIGQVESENAKPLALTGLVRAKATTQNGPIKRGDLLVTSSKPGFCMRADSDAIKSGMLLGKALEPLEEGDGPILILVE